MTSIGLGSLFTGMREQSIQLVRWLVLSGTNKLLDFMLLSVLRKDFSYTVRPEDLADDKDESRSGLSCSHRQKVAFDKDTHVKSIF